MSVQLNHIIVAANDKRASAEFLAGILGLEVGRPWGPFLPVVVANGVTLDYMDSEAFHAQHCAFLVSEDDFDAIFGRIRQAGINYYPDPFLQQPGAINHLYGGRGVYFCDPNDHVMEVITRPYGPTPQ